MKKILSPFVLLALGYCGFTQQLNSSSSATNPEVSLSILTTKARPAFVSTKAAKEFKKAFEGVTNEEWYEMPDGYRAKFTINDTRYRVDYDKKGHYQHTERTYQEKYLPDNIR